MLLFHCQPIPVNLIPNGNVAWFGYNTITLPTGQCHTKFFLVKNSPPGDAVRFPNYFGQS